MDWHHIYGSLLPFLTAYLDRLGGSKWKPARRYILPLLVWLFYPTYERAFFSIVLSVIISFNLDEIEDRNWEEIFLYGFGISFCLWTLGGLWALLPGAWWILGVYWSNFGLQTFWSARAPGHGGPEPIYWWAGKIDWKYVEIVRGFLIGLAVVMPPLCAIWRMGG